MTSRASPRVEWVSADDRDCARVCAVGGPDALMPRRLHEDAPDATLVAVERGADVARASLWWRDCPSFRGERAGAIGHYAAANPRAGAAVLEAACARLRFAGARAAISPMDGCTWRRYRLVTWRSHDPPFLLEPDNPPQWPSHFVRARFEPCALYRSTQCELACARTDPTVDAHFAARGYRVRALDPARPEDELATLWKLACDAFADNFLYTPLDVVAFGAIYRPLLAQVPPDLVMIAEHDARPIAFMFSFPDALKQSRGDPVDTVVIKTVGVAAAHKRQGIAGWLYQRTVVAARALGFRTAIHALMHDDNASRRLGPASQKLLRRYTLYARPL